MVKLKRNGINSCQDKDYHGLMNELGIRGTRAWQRFTVVRQIPCLR